jgi:hypothetical protein
MSRSSNANTPGFGSMTVITVFSVIVCSPIWRAGSHSGPSIREHWIPFKEGIVPDEATQIC